MIQAVIFDWAGTAVDYGCCAPAGVFVEVFARRGVDVTMAEAREPMGLHKRDHIAAVCRMPRVANAWADANGAAPTEADIDALYAEATPLQIECLPRYADPIEGVLDTVDVLRERGIRIGSTTGYNREMLNVLEAEAARRGYRPDAAVSAAEVPKGRPAPFMCWEAARQVEAWPARACVKVGDTVPDIDAGLNAGMWTIGVAMTGNEVGLNEGDLMALSFTERRNRVAKARKRLREAGAHRVVDRVADILPILTDLGRRVERGARP